MATTISESASLVDTAIGPLQVTQTEVTGYDIDDHVHSMMRAQAIRMQTQYKATTVNEKLAKNRMPVNIDGITAGGF